MRCRHLIFSAKSKKEDTIYMGIIFMSFLQRNLLCKNIYTMLSFMWSNELFSVLKWWLYLYCISLFSFLTYEVSYSESIKFFRRNVELIFAIDLSKTVFWGSNFCDFGPKISILNITEQSYLQICLNTKKIPKFQ